MTSSQCLSLTDGVGWEASGDSVCDGGYCILSSKSGYTVGVTGLSCRRTVQKENDGSGSTGNATDMH
jgi:hypothetical protein